MENKTIEIQGVSYTINRNIELLSVIMFLSNYYQKYPYLKSSYKLKYLEDIEAYFSKFCTHPAINVFEVLVNNGFSFDMPLSVMLLCDEDLNVLNENQDSLLEIARDIEVSDIEKFLHNLRDFKEESCFERFFEEHIDYYMDVLEKNVKLLPNIDFKNVFSDYFKMQPKVMEIIISISFGGVGFCICQNLKTSIVLGTYKLFEDTPIVVDDSIFVEMVIHEFSHSYVNPIIDKSLIPIECLQHIYDCLHDGYKEQYGCGSHLLSEEIVRAITARIVTCYVNEECGNRMVETDMLNNFIAV